jgi:hypothetical protein
MTIGEPNARIRWAIVRGHGAGHDRHVRSQQRDRHRDGEVGLVVVGEREHALALR